MATYPRPQFQRDCWHSLDGKWEFALDRDGLWSTPADVEWDSIIEVPFAPETPASGVEATGFFRACWYRRAFHDVRADPSERLVLHIGAVDYDATIWVNGLLADRHQGGYTPIAVDITDHLIDGEAQTVVVRAEDDPRDLTQPRGKQDWREEPHAIWYPRTSGIWQSVWLEPVPAVRIETLRWSSNLERWEIEFEARIEGRQRDDLRLVMRLRAGNTLLADDRYTVVAGEVIRRIALSDPGIDDARNELLWSPESPTLIDAEITLEDSEGGVLDRVHSYTALRAVRVQGDSFWLNGRPLRLRMVLDQGYWPETGLTAPDDDALRRDVELALAMGFNGVRKHQKIEDPRYLTWADRLGLLVWEEMPSVYRFTKRSVGRLTREWMAVMERDVSHPCIVAWAPFNESWGVPDLPMNAAQRDWVRALYHLTKTFDPSRPVIGNDGWESVVTDIVGIHDYESDLEIIDARYGGPTGGSNVLQRAQPAGRLLTFDAPSTVGYPIMLTEFGGIAFAPLDATDDTWGYSRAFDAEGFAERYRDLLAVVHRQQIFSGFCYTQFTDTYQEANGVLYADRTPKFPIEAIARATRGDRTPASAGADIALAR